MVPGTVARILVLAEAAPPAEPERIISKSEAALFTLCFA
jgi:hypothetical protein